MLDHDEIITEISLMLLVDGECRTLEMPIPYNYDAEDLIQLVMADVFPPDDGLSALEDATADDRLGDIDLDEIAGEMDPVAFEDWQSRARDLQTIDWAWSDLDNVGLQAGEWPGLLDDRTSEPSTMMLDETIEHDLANVTITDNETKAAFRAMRETCGASQSALADALGVAARTVKRWETPGQPEPPRDAWRLVEGWHADTVYGAKWHVGKAEELRYDCHEAYTLVIYRNQEEFDRVLAPMLVQAPSYHWQGAFAEARERALAERGGDSWLEIDHEYTNFPGTRSYWRANAAARMAAILMDAQDIPYGFAYPSEQQESLFWEGVWVPCADVQRVELSSGTIVTCGMR